MIQQATAAALQSSLQKYGKSSTPEAGSANRTQERSQQQNGPDSQSSPDVIASFSEAGLEAARTLTQPTEVSAQERTEERIGELELLESSVKEQQETVRQSEQAKSGSVDLMA